MRLERWDEKLLQVPLYSTHFISRCLWQWMNICTYMSRWQRFAFTMSRNYTRKRGRNNVTLDELIRTITPKGRCKPRKRKQHFNRKSCFSDLMYIYFDMCVIYTSLDSYGLRHRYGYELFTYTSHVLMHEKLVVMETASVPDSVKAELLQRIRSYLMSAALWSIQDRTVFHFIYQRWYCSICIGFVTIHSSFLAIYIA
jgi:hypothetical protein